jgi:putative aminopeptidase FrvX
MDQLGFVVRKIEPSGLIRLERLGGVPERALASQEVLICVAEGRDIRAVIANKSHHATSPEEKYRVLPSQEIMVDAGSRALARLLRPVSTSARRSSTRRRRLPLSVTGSREPRSTIAGCAVLVEAARLLVALPDRPTVHFVFSTQEEFNLRGALVAAQALAPDIAIQLDLMLATDTPDMQARGDFGLGAALWRPISRSSTGSRNSPEPRKQPAASRRAPLSKRASCPGRRSLSARSTRRPRRSASAFSTPAT